MHLFRNKSSTSHHRYHSSLKNQQSQQPDVMFVFQNKKIKLHKKQQQLLSIKHVKSKAQLYRRNRLSIPLLKDKKISQQKMSVVKSVKNQYKIFLKETKGHHHRLNSDMQFINGPPTTSLTTQKQQDIQTVNRRLFQSELLKLHRKSKSSLGVRQLLQKVIPIKPTYTTIDNFYVSGFTKYISSCNTIHSRRVHQLQQKLYKI